MRREVGQARREAWVGSWGPKSQMLQGRWVRRRGRAEGRRWDQVRKPMPMGRLYVGVG